MARNSITTCLAAVTLAFLAGCGGGGNSLVTAPVEGQVTLDGKPISGALVIFYDKAGKNTPSVGTTDQAGKFRVGVATTDGTIPGSYKVTIQYYTNLDGSPVAVSEGMDAQQLVMQGQAKQALPESYSELGSTLLTAEVKAGQPNKFDFSLKADGT